MAYVDKFTRGMSMNTGEEPHATPSYDRFQLDLIRSFLGERVLEVGAGAGRITQLVLSELCPKELVIAEPSAHFAPILRKTFAGTHGIKVFQSEVGNLPRELENRFDAIFGVCVLEHIEDDKQFLVDCMRYLAPGGRLVFLVPACQFLYSQLDENVGHFRRYNRPMMRTLAASAGLEVERLSYSNLVGFFGSLYFSKIRKVNYQGNASSRKSFFRMYSFFSEYVIPFVSRIERVIPVPFGLSLVAVYRRPRS